jgi:predicted metal-binding protein
MTLNLKEIADRVGVCQFGIVNPQDVEFVQEVREYCEDNRCQQYGKTWACPPAIGTVDECRERAWKYDKMLVFSGKFDLEDSFDFEGMMAGMQNFKTIAHALEDELKPFYGDHLMLSNEGCGNCEICTYPDQPCRFPDRVHGSIEGYGIFVGKLAKMAGIRYTNGENTVTYFGAFLYRDDEGL